MLRIFLGLVSGALGRRYRLTHYSTKIWTLAKLEAIVLAIEHRAEMEGDAPSACDRATRKAANGIVVSGIRAKG